MVNVQHSFGEDIRGDSYRQGGLAVLRQVLLVISHGGYLLLLVVLVGICLYRTAASRKPENNVRHFIRLHNQATSPPLEPSLVN